MKRIEKLCFLILFSDDAPGGGQACWLLMRLPRWLLLCLPRWLLLCMPRWLQIIMCRKRR
ncbi:MAG: hypothetical protein U0K74_03785 [Clostridia bacterium]|nr:hypothetical protein [Clostridia bacterium]